MLAQPLENFISATGADRITDTFIILIVTVFLLAVVFKRGNNHQNFTQYAPTLLISLGILGTFCGIVAGLLNFDPNDIDTSIGGLLEGMKTAFTTSLMGMAFSIIYKMLTSSGLLITQEGDKIDEGQIGIAELYSVMQQQVKGTEMLQQAIGGDTDSSLISQLKLLRSDASDNQKLALQQESGHHKALIAVIADNQSAFKDFQDRLWIKLQDFADMLSKSATETVIDALKQVITDFNNNLTEQFGDNFKQLNEAVLALVVWQDNYKLQLVEMTDKYALGVQAIGQTELSVAEIKQHTSEIPEHMTKLTEVTEINQHQITELAKHLDTFSVMRDKAVDAIPKIGEQIDIALKGVTEGSENLVTGLLQSAVALNEGVDKAASDMGDKFTEAGSNLTEEIEKSTQKLSHDVAQCAESLSTDISKASTVLAESLSDAASDVTLKLTASATSMSDSVIQASTELSGGVANATSAIARGTDEFLEGASQVHGSLQETSDVMVSDSKDIKKAFSDVNSELNDSFRNLSATMQDEAKKITKEFEEAGTTIVKEAQASKLAFNNGLDDMRVQLNGNLVDMAEQQTEAGNKVFRGLQESIEKSLGQTGEAVEKQVGFLDKALEREMNQSMTQLGSALTSITQQFTKDYRSLVDEMRNVVAKR